MANKSYIPNDVYDVKAVERLKSIPFDVVKNDVPKLLEWIQDGHWDVAEGISIYLAPHVNEIIEELLAVLNCDDSMWKYYMICGLIGRSPNKLNHTLIEVLGKISEHPSAMELEDGVDEVARDILQNKMLCE